MSKKYHALFDVHTYTSYLKKWYTHIKHRSLAQKITIAYIVLLLGMFMLVPMIEISSITDQSLQTFGIRNGLMGKTAWIILVVTLHLLLRNVSEIRKNQCYTLFGIQCTIPFANVFHLVILFLLLGTISDSIGFFAYHISQGVSVTTGRFLVSVWIFVGIIWQLVIARMQWKQKIVVHNHVASTTHQVQKEPFYYEPSQETLL